MKKLLVIAFLPMYFCSFAQNDFDSLGKYSYSIIGTDYSQTLLGSGFFIKNKNCLYFITAKHCIVHCDSNIADSKVTLVINRFNPEKSFPINTKAIKSIYPCHGAIIDSDYVVIQVDPQLSSYVNSVEAFLFPAFNKVESASIFGFPGFSYSKAKNGHVFISPTKMNLPNKIHGFYSKKDSLKRVDSANCFFEVDPFIKDMDSLGGFSGSPVFIRNNNKIRVLGVFSGSGTNPNGETAIWYAPIEFIQREIEKGN